MNFSSQSTNLLTIEMFSGTGAKSDTTVFVGFEWYPLKMAQSRLSEPFMKQVTASNILIMKES